MRPNNTQSLTRYHDPPEYDNLADGLRYPVKHLAVQSWMYLQGSELGYQMVPPFAAASLVCNLMNSLPIEADRIWIADILVRDMAIICLYRLGGIEACLLS